MWHRDQARKSNRKCFHTLPNQHSIPRSERDVVHRVAAEGSVGVEGAEFDEPSALFRRGTVDNSNEGEGAPK